MPLLLWGQRAPLEALAGKAPSDSFKPRWFLANWTLLGLFYRQTFGVWVVLAFPP